MKINLKNILYIVAIVVKTVISYKHFLNGVHFLLL